MAGYQRLSSNQRAEGSPLKKKRKFYYYALVWEMEFEKEDDVVYFAFSQPYSYSLVLSDILDKEEEIKPIQASLITSVPRKVVG